MADLSAITPEMEEKARKAALEHILEQSGEHPDGEPAAPVEQGRWFQPLSPAEKAAQAAFLGLGALDWGQTIRFTQDPAWKSHTYEQNPLLGAHPSRAKVNILVPLGLAAHTLGVWALPRPYRNVLQALGIAGEGYATYGNNQAGIKPTLPWK